jgi:hypothetical protein
VDYVLYPFLALFLTSILFIHLGQRSKASLVSLLSIVFLTVWTSSAHTLFHCFTHIEDPALIRMGGSHVFSYGVNSVSHPVFDAVNNAAGIASLLIFLVSFFVASISVSATRSSRPLPAFVARTTNRFSTSTLWLLAAACTVLSLVGMFSHHYVEFTGNLPEIEIPATIVALSGLACAILLAGIAIRRHFIQSHRD